MPSALDLTGRRFGLLTALVRIAGQGKLAGRKDARWRCVCDCGGESVPSTGRLMSGHAKSCGCLNYATGEGALDLAGQRFGRLVAMEYSGGSRTKKATWECLCDCGSTARVQTNHLRRGHTNSCGCLLDEVRGVATTLDLVGRRFARLTVTDRVPGSRHRQARWRCQCDCGAETIVVTGNLRNGHTQSCGCLRRMVLQHKRSPRFWLNKLELGARAKRVRDEYSREQRAKLGDVYLKAILVQDTKLRAKDIPVPLIEAKRVHLKNYRTVKGYGNDNNL